MSFSFITRLTIEQQVIYYFNKINLKSLLNSFIYNNNNILSKINSVVSKVTQWEQCQEEENPSFIYIYIYIEQLEYSPVDNSKAEKFRNSRQELTQIIVAYWYLGVCVWPMHLYWPILFFQAGTSS